MFNALTNLKTTHKAIINRKLTQPNIEKITNVYAKGLKDNAPDVPKMKLSVLGSFLQVAITDANPNHRLCPAGETSWCHFQRSIATNSPIRPHTPTIRPEVSILVYPVIKRLADPELLSRCAKMWTQNANESFNALVWRRCSKTEFYNKTSVETATFLAVLAFHMGYLRLTVLMEHLHHRMQEIKIGHSKKQILEVSKWKRRCAKTRRIEVEHQRQLQKGSTH